MRPLALIIVVALTVGGLAAGGPAVSVAGSIAGADVLDAKLDADIADFTGTAAVVVTDPATGYRYARNDDRVFVSASLYKLGLLVEAYRLAHAQLMSLDETVIRVEDVDLDWEDGWSTASGTELTVRDALERAITISDNSSSLALLRTLGAVNVNATLAALGMTATRINSYLEESERTAPFNTTTARDMERLFIMLARGKVVGENESREMLELLSRQRINDRLPAGLPAGTTVAHKTGDLWNAAHDAGVISTPFGPRVAVVLTEGGAHDGVAALAAAVAFDTYWLALDRTPITGRVELAHTVSGTLRPGERMQVAVTVTNTSSIPFDGAQRAVARWLDVGGASVKTSSAVVVPTIQPGRSYVLNIEVTGPPATGAYTLVVDVTLSAETTVRASRSVRVSTIP